MEQSYSKAEKVANLERLIEEAERRAARSLCNFSRQKLSGRKRDLFRLAKQYSPALAKMSEASFEEYMRELGCKFPPSASMVDGDFYTRLFPELTDRGPVG